MIRTANQISAPVHDQKDLWGTPDHIFKPLNDKFGFTLDPCCTIETSKCDKFYTPKEDGLSKSWYNEIVFCNPPYSRGNIDKWVSKLFAERRIATVIALLPVSTSADWFQDYVLGNTIYWVNKRIKFVGAKYTAPFSSMIVHFNSISSNLTWKQ